MRQSHGSLLPLVHRMMAKPGPAPMTPDPDETQDAAVDGTAADRKPVPTTLADRYRVERLLGEGGMGRVYAATDLELGRWVAVKLLTATSTHPRDRVRLLREAHALARLSHPNVVQIHDAGMDGEEIFIAMELVVGDTLKAVLSDMPPWRTVLDLFVSAGHGLQAAHDAGLVHRDFKPTNVLVGEDGRARVADFGLAADSHRSRAEQAGDVEPGERGVLQTELTLNGAVVGTPRYMAPEQHAGERTTQATDQYAFCVSLYEALYGIHPFGCGEFSDWLERMRSASVVAPRRNRGPRGLRRALVRGLAAEPENRHPDLASLLVALDRAVRRSRAVRIGGAAFVVLGGAVGVTALIETDETPCRGGDAVLRAVWSPERSAELTEALATTEAEAAEFAISTLDRYAQAWGSAHRQACLDASDGTLTRNTHERVDACLRTRLVSLDATAGALARGAETLGDGAASATSRLPPISRCREDSQLDAQLEPPPPAIAGEVDAIREGLARVEAQHAAGERDAALSLLETLESRADDSGYPPLRAQSRLVAARLAMDRMDWGLATVMLEEAQVRGLSVGADLLAAEAAARRVFVEAVYSGPEAVGAHDVALSRALGERVGNPAWLRALIENNVGVRHALAGEPALADAAFADAIEFASGSTAVAPVDRAGYLLNVALRTADPEQRDTQFSEALDLARGALGPRHGRTLEISMLRGQSTVEDDHARRRLEPVCRAYAERGALDWSQCHLCYWQLAEATTDSAQRKIAVGDAARCVDAAPEDVEGSPEWRGRHAMAQAWVALLDGRTATTTRYLEEANAVFDAVPPAPWLDVERATLVILEAEARGAAGPDDELVAGLEQAKETLQTSLAASSDQTPARRLIRIERLLSRRRGG